MKELEQAILSKGKILPGDVLKVGNFLNHQIDTKLLRNMAKDVVNHFGNKIDKILTIEASGLPFATAIALELDVPMVFAKKSQTNNVSGEMVSSVARSYTHSQTNVICVPRDYLKENERVLIVDDFLAMGEASTALLSIANQCNCNVVGIAIEIEKEFQDGGNRLRKAGIDVYSLASIKSMSSDNIEFNN